MTVRHGHYLGYVTDGCRCDTCTLAWNVYRQRNDLLRLRNETRLIDPADAIATATAKAVEWGVSPSRVLEAAGMQQTAAYRLLDGDQQRIDRDHAAAVKHVTIGDLDPATWMDSTFARQLRDQIMDRTGWSTRRVADEVGHPLGQLRFRGTRCRVGTWVVLRDALTDLERPRCAKCDRDPMPGGAQLCAPCFTASTMPSRHELDDFARRERNAARKRAERARARQEVAA